MNGMELMNKINSHPEISEIPVIMQTAANATEDIAEAVADVVMEAVEGEDVGGDTKTSPGRMPPGLSKKDKMPPGLEQQDKIPAGWEQGQKTGWSKSAEDTKTSKDSFIRRAVRAVFGGSRKQQPPQEE